MKIRITETVAASRSAVIEATSIEDARRRYAERYQGDRPRRAES
jgi:hypothetical protein